MAALKPEIGLVIRHAYLWWNEARAGREEGLKDRPCVIVHLAVNAYSETEVYIAPITHTPPEIPERAMEISKATKARLRLDAQTSWIISTEVNRFVWPGPDIRTVPDGRTAYGLLPANMAQALVRQIKGNAVDRSLLVVARDDKALNETVRLRKMPPKGKDRGGKGQV